MADMASTIKYHQQTRMNHEHMNVKNEVEQTGPKKPWVTPRLDDLDEVSTENIMARAPDFDGHYFDDES